MVEKAFLQVEKDLIRMEEAPPVVVGKAMGRVRGDPLADPLDLAGDARRGSQREDGWQKRTLGYGSVVGKEPGYSNEMEEEDLSWSDIICKRISLQC